MLTTEKRVSELTSRHLFFFKIANKIDYNAPSYCIISPVCKTSMQCSLNKYLAIIQASRCIKNIFCLQIKLVIRVKIFYKQYSFSFCICNKNYTHVVKTISKYGRYPIYLRTEGLNVRQKTAFFNAEYLESYSWDRLKDFVAKTAME